MSRKNPAQKKHDIQVRLTPIIRGRVPTPWMVEHMHEVSVKDFYDATLTEEDLKNKLAGRPRGGEK